MVNPEHQSVGCSIGSITPLASIDSISALALSHNPAAITLGEYKCRGLVPSSKLISKVPGSVPKPSNNVGNSVNGSNDLAHTASTIAINPRLRICPTPNRFLLAPFITDTLVVVEARLLIILTSTSPYTPNSLPLAEVSSRVGFTKSIPNFSNVL